MKISDYARIIWASLELRVFVVVRCEKASESVMHYKKKCLRVNDKFVPVTLTNSSVCPGSQTTITSFKHFVGYKEKNDLRLTD